MIGGEDGALDQHHGGEGSGPTEAADLCCDGQCHDASDEEEPDGGVKEFDPDYDWVLLKGESGKIRF